MTIISTMLLCALVCFIIQLAGDYRFTGILAKILVLCVMLIGSVPVFVI